MTLNVEGVVGCCMHCEKSLRGSHALETLHLALPSSSWLMRILRSIVAPSTAFMAFCDPKMTKPYFFRSFVLPQGEMFPNACLLPHHKCSRPTRVQPYTLSALPPKQAVRDARFPLRRSERAACVPVAFYESAGSLMSRSSRCRPDLLGWLVDPRTRLWAAFRRRTFSRRCSVRRCPSR